MAKETTRKEKARDTSRKTLQGTKKGISGEYCKQSTVRQGVCNEQQLKSSALQDPVAITTTSVTGSKVRQHIV